jgi:branched-chain amino acid transport system ATP-binding protein
MSAAEKALVLELHRVEKSFGPVRIVRGAELIVREGERHALIGPNGAGKSTLFNLISGRFAPSAGEIRLHGRRIDGLSPERINRLGLGRSFQITSIFQRLTTFENLRVAALPRFGVRFSVARAASRYGAANDCAEELLKAVQLMSRRDVPAGELPYSEQRALEIALTLASDPAVILLDEPTSGMSRNEAVHAMELIRAVTCGKTLLVVEHDMDVVFKLCDRISVLAYGKVIASGTPDEIRADRRVREAYLGSSVK